MKFTNKTLGWLIVLIIGIVLNYCLYLSINTDVSKGFEAFTFAFAPAYNIVCIILLLIFLINDGISFSINIPNPLSKIEDFCESRNKRKKNLENLLIDLHKAKSIKEIDVINEKIDVLKKFK